MSTAKLYDLVDAARVAAASDDLAVLESFTAKRPSIEERLAIGKALRDKVPRAEHARYDATRDRADPVEILERQNATRA